mgnify:CR=1 FL=1
MELIDSHPEVQALAAEEKALATVTASVPLACPTRDVWVKAALADVNALLDDHAQCELKAASNALAMVGRFPDNDELVRRMAGLAKEEMVHYRMVRHELIGRGGTPKRPVANPYMKGMARDRLAGSKALLDDLLVCALIEARSCERFLVLARALRSPEAVNVADAGELAYFYERLARSESGHAHLFVALAEDAFDHDLVRNELLRRSSIEAATIESLPVTPRMHGGHRQA